MDRDAIPFFCFKAIVATLCGFVWLALMTACGIPADLAGKIAAAGSIFAAGMWSGILNTED